MSSSRMLEIIGQTQLQHICVGEIPERIRKAITIAGKWKTSQARRGSEISPKLEQNRRDGTGVDRK